MKKNNLIIVGILVLLLLIGGTYFFLNQKSSVPSATTSNTNQQDTKSPITSSSSQKSLKDLLLAGISQKCTYTEKLENIDMSGTVYSAGGKMRNDYTSITPDATMTGHMIVDGTTSYMWTDGQPTGFKMTIDPNQTVPTAGTGAVPTTTSQKQQDIDINKVIDYNCGAWIVDNSLFSPPSNIKFTDYSAILTPPAGGTTGAPSFTNQCGVCDSLTGDDKTQCRAALKCS